MAVIGQENCFDRLYQHFVVRLKKAVDINRLTDIIVTYFHPDHVAGVPLVDEYGLLKRSAAKHLRLHHPDIRKTR
jgi:glyoxylase-like metal-dependent hydrolase (beta-lactamase superfamily II)